MIHPGDVAGKYTVIAVGDGYLRYRKTKGSKRVWFVSVIQWNEWMELMGFLRKRCNGRPSGAN
jgi:hypothetical protein